MKPFRIGIIGYSFGRIHAEAYRLIPFYKDVGAPIELVAVATSRPETAAKAKAEGGFAFATADWRELVASPEVDIVHVCAPDDLHHPIASAALEAGKHVYCEKPLARTVAEAEDLCARARASGRVAQVAFQCRFGSAAQAARRLIQDGTLGEITSFRVTFLHSGYEDPDRPLTWRLDQTRAGGGVLYDLGSHAIDLITFLLGRPRRVMGLTRTFIKDRPAAQGSTRRVPVGVDDVALALLETEAGAVGLLEATRLATGVRRGPDVTIYGTRGSVAFNGATNPDELNLYLKGEKVPGLSGWERINTGGRRPVPLNVAAQAHFLEAIRDGRTDAEPGFEAGLLVQRVLAAVQESDRAGEWVTVEG
ncbi:MAG: Gfo/Idh/MocA family oxidoreductase [Symbiobacterium sp.]|uniref:Gfo/Idh/MocA family protein n=1 Tax=Symbiobacterium sp. TaxID=1971213 RepID=UPI003464A515